MIGTIFIIYKYVLTWGFTPTPKFGLGATSFYITTNTTTIYKIAKVH